MFFYLATFVYSVGHDWLGWFQEAYQTDIAGPDQHAREDSVTAEGLYPVNEAGMRHVMELTPIARFGEHATGSLTLRYEVRSPKGAALAKGQETLRPASGPNWTMLRTEFTSPEDGWHKVVLEIPKPVRKVRVRIRELQK